MINQPRLLSLFKELSAIDNPSLSEAKLCTRLKAKLTALGITPHEDDTSGKIGGNCGNLYARWDGSLPLPPLLLSAHMDSVAPAENKKAVFHPDGTITSDGTTVLGSDDLSGICAILEAITSIKESGAEHRPIELLFDVAEEMYCAGIQQFDFSRLQAKEAYVFDLDGPVGTAAYQAPSIISFRADFHGKSAHAAFAPEDGIHAIKAAADAVAAIACGHVEDVTVNIGTISGGSADNVIPDHCTVTGEVRSLNAERAEKQLLHIKETMENAAGRGTLTFQSQTLCRAIRIEPAEPVATRFRKVCPDLQLNDKLITTYGGSDNNHFFHNGIRGLVVAAGMNDCHSLHEYTSVCELEKAARLAQALILSED